MRRSLLAVLIVATLLGGCSVLERQQVPAAPPEVRPARAAGYLQPQAIPDSAALLPPPPARGSPAFALDEEISSKALVLRGSPRWDLAAEDAELSFPEAAGTFSCAIGAPISEEDTPRLYNLLRRVLADAGRSTSEAKHRYRRARPFMVNQQPTCTPDWEAHLEKNGSYPSGHTALGWAWALILAEIAPDRADAILARGRAYGESRVVCNVHWQSDVVEGRFMGAAVVAGLHANSQFRSDLAASKKELAAVRARGLPPLRDCSAEAAALAIAFPPVRFEAEVRQAWQGDYPVAALGLLPDGQRDQPVGFIDNPVTFEDVWHAWKPSDPVPDVDFTTRLVLYARNTQFYNRLSIGRVTVTGGIAEVIALETLSAIPVEDKVALSMAVVDRAGIFAVQSGQVVMPIRPGS
jgi:acid phosphatase (class A)